MREAAAYAVYACLNMFMPKAVSALVLLYGGILVLESKVRETGGGEGVGGVYVFMPKAVSALVLLYGGVLVLESKVRETGVGEGVCGVYALTCSCPRPCLRWCCCMEAFWCCRAR